MSDGKDEIAALTASVAEELGIRALRGGGAVFAHHGLISPRVSRTLRVVVDPLRVRKLGEGLVARGLTVHASSRSMFLPPAVVQFGMSGSDARVALHGVIPGFHQDPGYAFEQVWAEHDILTLHSVPVPVLGRLSTIVFSMHHRLGGQRKHASLPGNRDFFSRQFSDVLSENERDELVHLVQRLGAQGELRELVALLGRDAGPPTPIPPAYAAARLALAAPTQADIALLARLETGTPLAAAPVTALALAGAWVRMRRASARVAARDRPAA
jgi:hypothetical protein